MGYPVWDESGMAGYLKLLLACVIWGIGWTAARYSVVHLGPFLTGEYRFILSFLFALPFFALAQDDKQLEDELKDVKVNGQTVSFEITAPK